MSKSIRLSPLADHIVNRTPPLSYQSREQLEMVIFDRNANRLKGSWMAIDILTKMVEQRLIDRDGAAFKKGADDDREENSNG